MSAVPRMAAPKMTVPKAMQPPRPALAPAQPASFAASPANDSTQPPGSVSPNDAPIIAQTRQNFARTLSPPADSGYAAASQDEATRPLAERPAASPPPLAPVAPAAPLAPSADARAAPPVAVPLAILPGANRRPTLVVGAVTTVAPPRGSPQALLVTALVAAINADDLQATRDILDALHQQYPDIRFTETFVTRVRQLGLDPHQ